MDKKDRKIAIVHDFLNQYGGAERVLEVLCEIFPEAPIFTLLYDKEKMRGKFADRVIHTSFLQKFPRFFRRRYQWLLPLMPTAPETFDLRDFDLVISSSGAWSKGIVTRLDTKHVAYIHSPMRFVWDYADRYLSDNRKEKLGILIRPFFNYLRIWDKLAADRPDYLIANSKYTQQRIKKYYGRESAVIYPPAFAEAASAGKPVDEKSQITNHKSQTNYKSQIPNPKITSYELPVTGYFLVVSRLSAYKKIDVIIEAFNKLGLPLLIVGEGKQEERLRSIAWENVKFSGWQSDEKLAEIYKNARAFVFAGVEDFGIAPVEAMAHGVPVVALRSGGLKEIVVEGRTGEFFDEPTPEVIADGIRRFVENEKKYDKQFIINRAGEFSKERFVREMGEYFDSVLKSKD